MNQFEQLGLESGLLKAINDMGFESPSEVQQKAIPILLEQDTDLVALAQTGTGKTAAFGFPLIQKINIQKSKLKLLSFPQLESYVCKLPMKLKITPNTTQV